MRQEDEEKLREVCQDPIIKDAMCKYRDYLITDIASHKRFKENPNEDQVVGHFVQREQPINCYHIQHDLKRKHDNPNWYTDAANGQGLTDSPDRLEPDEDYIGMPVEVQFEKNIGFKRKAGPNWVPRVPVDHPKLKHKCNCRGTCTCKCGCKPIAKNLGSKPPSSHDVNAQKMNERKRIYQNYTIVDPSINQRVKSEIELRATGPRKKHDYWSPNKYVIEQINKSNLKAKLEPSTIRQRVTFSSSSDRKSRPRNTQQTGATNITDKVTINTQGSSNVNLLKEMVEIMDICLKKNQQPRLPTPPPERRPPSVVTRDASVQAMMIEPTPQPTAPQPIPVSAPQPNQKRHVAPSKYGIVTKQDRVIKEVSSHAKVIKVVERQYELDKDSFEISELMVHVPSRLFNLQRPIEKELKYVNATTDISQFDTEHFSPQNVEIVDEHIAEIERRRVYEKVLHGVEIPVIKAHVPQ